MRPALSLLMICGLLLLCAACGKRPDVVDAPDGSDPKAYPHTYPDVKTDPAGIPIPKP